jgi:hypothetical protein
MQSRRGWLLLAVAVAVACHRETIVMDKHDDQHASDTAPLRIDSMGPDIVLPKIVYPDDLPFSAWEGYATGKLLQANGFGDTRDDWRRAAGSPLAVIRSGGLLLLSASPHPEDRDIFAAGLRDRYDAVRVWAARGLLALGDADARSILEGLRNRQPAEGEFAPLIASRLLGEHRDAAAFETISRAAVSLPDLAVVLKNLEPFVALQDQRYGADASVDVWPLYARGLAPGDGRAETIALAQLEEVAAPGAAPVLRDYLAREPPPSPSLRVRAQRLLDRITAR